MTLTDEQRETVERVLKGETTEAYCNDGWDVIFDDGRGENDNYVETNLFHGDDSRKCALSSSDEYCANAAPLLKATILEQRERIAELEGMVEHVCYVRDNLLDQKIELQDRLRAVGESYDA